MSKNANHYGLTRGQILVLPTLGEALYEGPNPQKTAKSCSNCGMFSLDNFCAILGDKAILPFDVCSFQIDGVPAKKRIRLNVIPLDPVLAGLSWAPAGTRCGTCNFFRPDAEGPMGYCVRIRDDNHVKLARVHEYGCSARYRGFAVQVT